MNIKVKRLWDRLSGDYDVCVSIIRDRVYTGRTLSYQNGQWQTAETALRRALNDAERDAIRVAVATFLLQEGGQKESQYPLEA